MKKEGYNRLVSDIGLLLEEGRRRALQSVNAVIVQTYWGIGRRIVEFEQEGKVKADYGTKLLKELSIDLTLNYGKGFGKSNIYSMRLFYLNYPKFQTLSGKLSWSHYVEILGVANINERRFYEAQCVEEQWGIRELRRQIASGLFYRISAHKNQRGLLQLSYKKHIVKKPEDIIKDPYVFEFLDFSESLTYPEKQIEERIMDNLQMFLLELGQGFAFVARQFKMAISHKKFYADLVFYHKILRCYVVIDLKKGALTSRDAGQMNLYLNYFKENMNKAGDALPIGIIMARDKEEIEVKYTLGDMNNRIFATKYRLSLPSPDELKKVVEEAKKD
ncbi:MAG: DUF1016 family protein [Nanoarchaeota archaeon]|nr:DUF1016 family protein [Nanoarchaeota archaeon]